MQAFLGGAVAVLAALVLMDGGPTRHRIFRASVPLSDAARVGLMGVIAVAGVILAAPAVFPQLRAGLFSFCGTCPIPGTGGAHYSPADAVYAFLLGTWYYAATVLPVFAAACALSGVLAVRRSLRLGSLPGAFLFAALLPVCSCGVVPLGKALIDRGGSSVRNGLMFIAAAPLLSPIIVALGASVLGARYVLARIAASFVMALVVALVVPPFLEPRRGAVLASSPGDRGVRPGGSALLAGWRMLTGLLPYVLYGLVVGAAVAAVLPSAFVERALSAGPLSMAAAVVVGVPVNLCAGEEILLTAPLARMGFSMGHAIAFALAGTGICAGSLPLLRAALGRRATLAMVALYLAVPFALGTLLSAFAVTQRLEPRVYPEPPPRIQAEAVLQAQSLIDKSG